LLKIIFASNPMKSIVTRIKFCGVEYDVERVIHLEDGTDYYVLLGSDRKVKDKDCEVVSRRLVV